MIEVYKIIDGYDGKYKISNLGHVMSTNYRGNTKKQKVLSAIRHHNGYLVVHLVNPSGIIKNKLIHVLVAEAFIEKPEGKRFVNHIDGNKHNNRVDNLEWVTSKENMNHAIRTGLRNPHKNNHPKGADVVNSKPVLQYSKDGVFIKRWECISDAARAVGCKPCSINNNIAGRIKSVHGFVWKCP